MASFVTRISSVTSPATVAELKSHLKIGGDEEDTYLGVILDAASRWAVTYTNNAVIPISVSYSAESDDFIRSLTLPYTERPTIISVTGMEVDEYTEKSGKVNITSDTKEVTVEYTASSGTVINDVKMAVLIYAAVLYEYREGDAEPPKLAKQLLAAYKRWVL